MKRVLSVILSVIMIISATGTVFAAEAEKSILKVGISTDFPPFEYYENGELTGFDVDLIKHLAAFSGYEIEFREKPFDALFPAVLSGEVDCIISALTITEERRKNTPFTDPYITNGEDFYGIPVPDTKLLEKLNTALKIAKADGTVDTLISKYKLDSEGGYSTAWTNTENHGSSPSEWARESVDKAYTLGIPEKGRYQFTAPVTREEFCEMIFNLAVRVKPDFESFIPDSFTDTKNEKILRLNSMGIISGKTATEFAPEDTLTREEAATVIIRMINKLIPMAATEMWFEYDDINDISEWASDSVQTISNLGFMKGVANNRFAPKESFTAEQALTTLVRIYENAEASCLINNSSDIGIIGGADGPTSIIVGDTVTNLEKEDYKKFREEITGQSFKLNKFYIEEAKKLISESVKLAADKNFIGMYTPDSEVTERLSALGTLDFENPGEIFMISADREKIVENIEALAKAENVDLSEFGENGFEHIWRRLNFSALASMINASYGAKELAALTILTNSRGYIMPKDFKNDFALFMEYEGEYSAMVSFSEYGDGVISATMNFVKNGEKDNVLRRLYEIYTTLGEGSIKVYAIK